METEAHTVTCYTFTGFGLNLSRRIMSLNSQQIKTIDRSRYENGSDVSGYCDVSFRKLYGAGMSLVATSGAARCATTSADPGSGQIKGE
jgi:hypothetical protein